MACVSSTAVAAALVRGGGELHIKSYEIQDINPITKIVWKYSTCNYRSERFADSPDKDTVSLLERAKVWHVSTWSCPLTQFSPSAVSLYF